MYQAFARIATAKKGVTTVEFALMATATLMWLFGIMEFSRAYWDYEVILEVATEGARCMGIQAASCAAGGTYNETATMTFVTNLAQSRGLALTANDVELTRPANCAGTQGFAQVQISYRFQTVLPSLISALSEITLMANACYFDNQ